MWINDNESDEELLTEVKDKIQALLAGNAKPLPNMAIEEEKKAPLQ